MAVKRVLNVFLVWCMLVSLVSFGWLPNQLVPQVLQTGAAQAAQTVNIGDYINFGSYNGAPILWRVINVDETTGDPILFADRILTLKAFDAAGNYHTGDSDRVGYGSNFYKDSNIRQWLNSSSANSGANTIDWIQNDPSVTNMYFGYNPYNNEKGFLADGNFTQAERSLIKPYTHKVLLDSLDYEKKDGGTEPYTSNSFIDQVVQNYDAAYFQNVTDSIFLLSVKQLKEWVYDNNATFGTNDNFAKPTPEAVTQSIFQDGSLSSEINFLYWLNTPSNDSSGYVRYTDPSSNVMSNFASIDYIGVRPALQLDLSSDIFKSGAGTSTNPYSLQENEFPTLSSIEVSSDNKTIYVYSDIDLKATPPDKSKITLTANGETVAASNITATVEGKRTLKIVSTTALSSTNNKLALSAGVVKSDAFNEDNIALTEKTLTVTPKFPTELKSTTASSDNKSVSLELDVTGLTNPTIEASRLYDSLKSAVKIATDGKTYVALGADDTVAYNNSTKKLTVTFENALTSTKAMIQVAAGALALTPTSADNKVLSPAFTSKEVMTVPVTDVNDAPAFADVPYTAWYSTAIEYLVKNDVLNGDGSGKFNPEKKLTRAEFMKMLVIAFDMNPSSTDSMPFSDVTNEKVWYYPYILAASRAKIVSGYTDGTFKPNAAITRQEMMVFLNRAINYTEMTLPTDGPSLSTFNDADEISAFAIPTVEALVKASIISGSNGMLRPTDESTRANGATLVYRVMKMLEK